MKHFWIIAAALWAGALGAQQPRSYGLSVDGLACPFCAYGIEKQLHRIEGVEAVDVDINAGRIRVTLAEGRELTEEQARKATEDAGFTLRGFEPESGS